MSVPLSLALALCAVLCCCSTVSGDKIRFPVKQQLNNPTCYGSRLHKISLVQDMYVQYSQFVATVPDLYSFSTCFWLSVADPERVATALNYAVDETTNTDNLTVQYRPKEGYWSLNINGRRVYQARALKLVKDRWTHFCHSWDGRTGQWGVWQDGQVLESGVNQQSVGQKVPSGGKFVTGQHQNTLFNGMDVGEGIIGSVTLLHVSSVPLNNPQSFETQRLVNYLANDCSATDRGDVIGWLRTPYRGYGGVTTSVAQEKCRFF